ncbi:MAG: YicC family protein [Opitutaceae bacterium]|jgi:uncharacterized protein YicC (UPF0701 family)|nr:YicC family protein [Opitutaceae bacterium]
MNSMTGYGRAAAALGTRQLTAQITSVNRRTLDISLSLPREWDALEPDILELVRGTVERGKVHVSVELGNEAGGPPGQTWDTAAASATLDAFERFLAGHGLPFAPTPELAWQILSSQRGNGAPPPEEARDAVLETVGEALHALAAMRAREGEALLVDFFARLETLSRHVAAIAARAPQVAPAWRAQLLKRLREAGLELDAGDERVLKEVALFADRCDISEELTRLRSHLSQLGALLRAEGGVGRKAEFILQEIGREAHTIGSKANDLAVSQAVIELKNELERVREQVANVE